jgi:hypothetical protein
MNNDSFYLCTFGVCYLTSYDRITDPNVANTWYPVMTVSTNKLEGKHYTADQAKKINADIGGKWYRADATYTEVDPSTLVEPSVPVPTSTSVAPSTSAAPATSTAPTTLGGA